MASSNGPSFLSLGLSDYQPPNIQEAAVSSVSEQTAEPDLASHSPAAEPAIPNSVAALDAENRGATEHSAPTPVAAVHVDDVKRRCQWCGTEAVSEDRFCRVCGSVF
jgi:hypothetical protein